MRTKLIILISVFLLSCNEQQNPSISDKGGIQLEDRSENPPIIIESEMQMKDRMRFSIKNTTIDSIFCSIGIDAKFDSNWEGILMNINGKPGDLIAPYTILIPYQNLNIEFDMKSVLGEYYQKGFEYRLNVSYKIGRLGTTKVEVFSSSFFTKF
jgi:hypothetical protein